MRHEPDNNRLKLLISMTVLAVVFVVAGIAQFTGKRWTRSEDSAPAPSVPAPDRSQPRAVFGAGPDPVAVTPPPEKQAQPGPVKEDGTSRSLTAGDAATAADIDRLLERWRGTVVRGEVKAQVILYAPRMEQFFNRRNVTREVVLREKTRLKELYPNVRRYEISDVQVEPHKDNNLAVVSFRKEWDMDGDRRFSGAERQRLKIRRIS